MGKILFDQPNIFIRYKNIRKSIKMVHALEVFNIPDMHTTEWEEKDGNFQEDVFENFLSLLNGEVVTIEESNIVNLEDLFDKYQVKHLKVFVELMKEKQKPHSASNPNLNRIEERLNLLITAQVGNKLQDLGIEIKYLLDKFCDDILSQPNKYMDNKQTIKDFFNTYSQSDDLKIIIIKCLFIAFNYQLPNDMEKAFGYSKNRHISTLHIYAIFDEPDLFEKQLKEDKNLEMPDLNGQWPEHYLAYIPNSKPKIIAILKSNGFDITHKDNNGHTPLIISINSKSNMLFQYLIKKDDDITIDNDNNTYFHLAARARNYVALDLLVSFYPNKSFIANKKGYTPLDTISRDISSRIDDGTVEAASILLLSIPDTANEQALRLIQKQGKGLNPSIVIDIIKKIRKFNINQRAKGTTLLIAMLKAQYPTQTIIEAIEIGARIDEAGKLGDFPIHAASKHAPVEVLKFILDRYPDEILRKSKDSSNVLIYASMSPNLDLGYEKFVILADINNDLIFEANDKDATPLMAASSMGNAKIIRYIYKVYETKTRSENEWRLYVNKQNHVGCTALHFACQKASSSAIEELAKFKDILDPNIQNIDGDLPFHLVGGNDAAHREAQKALLTSGLDIKRMPNKKNKDPLLGLHGDNIKHFKSIQMIGNAYSSSFASTTLSEEPKRESTRKIDKKLLQIEFNDFANGNFDPDDIQLLDEKKIYAKDGASGMNLLSFSISNNQNKYIEHLINKCRDLISDQDPRNRTAIYISIQYNNYEGFEELIRIMRLNELQAVLPIKARPRGLTAVHLAAKNGEKYLKAIHNKWPSVFNEPYFNQSGQTPFSYAISSSNEEGALFIAHSLGNNLAEQAMKVDKDDFTPFDYAIKYGMSSLLELILEQSEFCTVNPNIIMQTPKEKLKSVSIILFRSLRSSNVSSELKDKIICAVASKDDINLFDAAKDMYGNDLECDDGSLLEYFAKSEISNSHFCITVILAKYDKVEKLSKQFIDSIYRAISVSNQNMKKQKLEKFLSRHEKLL